MKLGCQTCTVSYRCRNDPRIAATGGMYMTCLSLLLSSINYSFLLDGPAVNDRTELVILVTGN